MTDTITLTGIVGTFPRHFVSSTGVQIVSFRLASSQRRFDRSQDRWIDGDTNWYTVSTFRQLAVNALSSLTKGERVVITGRLRVKPWSTGDKSGTAVEIDADAIGHDLAWGTSSWVRTAATGSADGSTETGEGGPAALETIPTDSTSDGGNEERAGTLDTDGFTPSIERFPSVDHTGYLAEDPRSDAVGGDDGHTTADDPRQDATLPF